MSVLEKLKDNRTSILLAEIGAYLHDLGKGRKEFIEKNAKNGNELQNWHHGFPEHIFGDFPELKNELEKIKVKVCNKEVSLIDFISKHHRKKKEGEEKTPEIIQLISAECNGYDGIDSGLDKGAAEVKQRKEYTFIANAFGYEFEEIEVEEIPELTKELYESISKALKEYNNIDIKDLRNNVILGTREYYLRFLGETRRPANDVTLWDHSYSVATLFKCAVAKNVVDCNRVSFEPLDFSWKVLCVSFDILSILGKGIKIGDMLGYWERIEEILECVKELIEVKYPLGNEIYRDNSGIFFLIPDINCLEEIRDKILNIAEEKEPEIMPLVTTISPEDRVNCDGAGDTKQENGGKSEAEERQERKKKEEEKKEILKKILSEARKKALKEICYPTSSERFLSKKFLNEWDEWNGKEICPICCLRPMDENADGCEHCLERRIRRAERWIENPKHTIWLEEVADFNDKVALLVGCFILDRWLDGSFIKTMVIKAKPSDSDEFRKNPSPARIRRCWESTENFIKLMFERLENYKWKDELRTQRVQFRIIPNPGILKGSTCDIEIGGIKLSPVCIDKEEGTFVTTINLQLLETLGKTVKEIARSFEGKDIRIKCEGEGWENAKIEEARPAEDEFQQYLPYIKVYDFPDQFMVLVPAYEALDIAKEIVREYEEQFSKVRDRLPFHIGIIAFHRRTSLYAVMDAGRRLLEKFKAGSQSTIDAKVEDRNTSAGKIIKLKIKAEKYASIPFEWEMSYATGDPEQEDLWHPYVRVKGGNPNRTLSFDYTGNGDYVVHVKEIQQGDQIKIEPSYFTLFYLENNTDRFTIGGALRPLHDLHRPQNLWEEIEKRVKQKKWRPSQIHAFWKEVRERQYYESETFEKFVRSALINTMEIYPEQDKELLEKFLHATKDGLFDLCLRWHLQVRKAMSFKGGKK